MGGCIRVLHVDDDPSFTELTKQFLRKGDSEFEIVAETTVDAAREHLGATTEFDCIVCDYAFPGTDGIAFLKEVRMEFPHLPFILFTGRGSESVASEALKHGATDYLRKRSGTEQYDLLANRIRNAVQQYRDRQEQEKSERYRQELYRVTADASLTTEQRVERLLELGCERLGVENGHVVRIDREARKHTVIMAAGSELLTVNTVTDLDRTYCREVIKSDDILTMYNASEEGWEGDPAYEYWDIGCYIGGKLEVGDRLFGTVCFADRDPRDRPFTEAERAFVDLLCRWLSHVFERQSYERKLAAYEALVDLLPVGYARVSADGDILAANPALVAMTGAESESALLDREAGELFAGDGGLAFLDELRETGVVEGRDHRIRTLDGRTVPVSLTGRTGEGNGDAHIDLLVDARAE